MKSCGFIVIEPALTGCWGIDTRWDSIAVAYYDKRLPDSLAQTYKRKIMVTNNDFTGIMVAHDPQDIRLFADWMTETGCPFVVISVFSTELANCKEVKEVYEVDSGELFGFDYVIVGCGSMIQQACYTPAMEHWQSHFNQFGLFESADLLRQFEAEYLDHVAQKRLEELSGPSEHSPFSAIEIREVDWHTFPNSSIT